MPTVAASLAAPPPIRSRGGPAPAASGGALADRLAQAERLATLGQLTAGLAHQLASPLACVLSALQAMRDDLSLGRLEPGALAEALDDALHGATALREVVVGMRHLGRGREALPSPVDVRAEARTAAALVRQEVKARARLTLTLPDRLPDVRARPADLAQVFLNLLLNAAQAIPEGAPERHEVRLTAWAEGGEVRVAVRDTGCGLDEGTRARLFEPFFTTRSAAGGTGLGLATSRTLVAAAGGTIEVESVIGAGSTFTVRLPALAEPLAAR